ncbi:MAG: T9SS type A sorting domain-containing protein, partial [Lentimicrobiaceae bacterium]|nr:T9SS type A sorting domain-containing protein [Lentimicrobiaceae bacterium]
SSLDLTNQEVISVVIYNNGIVDIAGDVELAYKVNGGTEIIETYTISELAPGDEITYTFNAKADFSAFGFYTVEARVDYEFDSNPYNNTITGKTKKMALIELPFVDEFDTPESMLNWSTIDGNGDGLSWNYDNWFLTDADGGRGCLQVLCQTYGADEYLITDPIVIPGGNTYTMSFYAARLGNDNIKILYGTTFNVEEMEVLEVVIPNLYEWEKIELSFEIETSGNYFFAFHYYAVHSAGGGGINFDKFRLETQVSAPDYKPFPTSNAMWRENFGGFETDCEEYQYLITGDTIINDLTYHILQKSGVRYSASGSGWCNQNFGWPIDHYAGCFRNDVSAQKVYYIGSDMGTERVIYDFSLSVGDTIPELPGDFYHPQNNTIKSIDSIEIGGIYYKRFEIENRCLFLFYIIEGIGSTYGLLSSTCPFEVGSELICFSINEETIYPYVGYDCKPAIYNAIENYKPMINLYPNPTTGELRIENGEWRINNVEVFDVYGKKITTNHLSLTTIDVSHLSNGIYFLKIYTESGVVVKKVVKK